MKEMIFGIWFATGLVLGVFYNSGALMFLIWSPLIVLYKYLLDL